MSDDASFQELLNRVRARDEQAATELVRRYESAIRRAVRVRLTDPRLRRLVDSMDICQSVLANFFVRAASGQFELERSEQLVKLLVTMARNKLINEAVKQQAARRDMGRVQTGGSDDTDDFVATGPSPSQVVANQELLEECRRRLSAEERQIADQRALGQEWADIAAGTGENPDAVRVRFGRALDRVAREMGLEA